MVVRLTGSGIVVGGDDKRSLGNGPSRDDECGDDDDDNNYYRGGNEYYQERREYPEYLYDEERRRRTVFIRGTGREIRIVFRSDSSGTRSGFSALFTVQQGDSNTFYTVHKHSVRSYT